MVKREWIRVGACAIIGVIVGIILAISKNTWCYALLGPFYSIGTFYGIKLILTMLGGVGKAAGTGLFKSITGRNWIGLLLVIVILIVAIGVIFTSGWILGMFAAGKAVFDAYRIDSEISSSSNSSYDTSWDGVGNSSRRSWRKKRKSKSSSDDDYDNMSW